MNQPRFTVQVRDFCDVQKNTIDLNKLFQLGELRQTQLMVRTSPFLEKGPTVKRPLTATLSERSRSSPVALAPLFPPANARVIGNIGTAPAPVLQQPRTRSKSSPKLPPARAYSITRTSGTLSRIPATADLHDLGEQNITLPFFVGKHITAAALKILSGHPDEIVLQKKGKKWAIVPDDHLIDLTDRSQVYRVGPVDVYS